MNNPQAQTTNKSDAVLAALAVLKNAGINSEMMQMYGTGYTELILTLPHVKIAEVLITDDNPG
jgi:hypothetical protein